MNDTTGATAAAAGPGSVPVTVAWERTPSDQVEPKVMPLAEPGDGAPS